jgi:hypothetical protein
MPTRFGLRLLHSDLGKHLGSATFSSHNQPLTGGLPFDPLLHSLRLGGRIVPGIVKGFSARARRAAKLDRRRRGSARRLFRSPGIDLSDEIQTSSRDSRLDCVVCHFCYGQAVELKKPQNVGDPRGRLKVVQAFELSLAQARGTVLPIAVSSFWRVSDTDRRTRGAVLQAAGIRNPSHFRTHAPRQKLFIRSPRPRERATVRGLPGRAPRRF